MTLSNETRVFSIFTPFYAYRSFWNVTHWTFFKEEQIIQRLLLAVLTLRYSVLVSLSDINFESDTIRYEPVTQSCLKWKEWFNQHTGFLSDLCFRFKIIAQPHIIILLFISMWMSLALLCILFNCNILHLRWVDTETCFNPVTIRRAVCCVKWKWSCDWWRSKLWAANILYFCSTKYFNATFYHHPC